jgi:hypothetical protein
LVADAKSKFDEEGKLTDETTRGLIIQQLINKSLVSDAVLFFAPCQWLCTKLSQ